MQYEHHREAVEVLARQVAEDPTIDAVILTGSVPRGTARPDSDLDCYVVVDPAEYERRQAAGDLAWMAGCEYPGGYVDGKVVTLEILEAAAERGSEPTRASFSPASVVYSRIGDLTPLVARIAVYPEANRAENMKDFFSAACLNATYFGPQALQSGNAFLATHAVAMTVLYSGRAVLAHNRILYPCPKQLMAAVAAVPERPEGFVEGMEQLLAEPTTELFATHLERLGGFCDWGISGMEVLTRFMELDEWTWRTREPELAQR